MNILSVDVGIINLSYCIINNDKTIDWDLLNLKEDHLGKICSNKASHINNNYHYCKTHVNELKFSQNDYVVTTSPNIFKCDHMIKNKQCCKTAIYLIDDKY